MSRKSIVVFVVCLILEFLLAWAGFVFASIVGVVFVVLGWVTLGYGVYVAITKRKK
ncbi:MAG TPA: hypothetical protein VLG40_01965 [Candidatus Saccharimonas sp.]|nr:hypothetical protein [Candidatus Saccharimonas sp.]